MFLKQFVVFLRKYFVADVFKTIVLFF